MIRSAGWAAAQGALLSALMRQSFDCIVLSARPSSEILEVSDSFCVLTGYTREELVGREARDLKFVLDPEIGARITRMLDAGVGGVYQRRLRRKDGRIRRIEFTVTLLASDPNLVLTTLRDVTERERSRAQLRFQGAVAEALNAGVAMIRARDGVIVNTNSTLERLLGYARGELVGRHAAVLSELDADAVAQTGEEIRDVLRREAVWQRDVRCVRKDGTSFSCSCNLITLAHPEHGDVWVSVHTEAGARHDRAIGRRTTPPAIAEIEFRYGPLCIHPQRSVVEHDGRRHILTRTEWLLFAALLAHPGEVLSRDRLATLVWGDQGDIDRSQELEVYVSRLRRKVEADPRKPVLVQTVRRRGYRLAAIGPAPGGRRDEASDSTSSERTSAPRMLRVIV